MKVSGLTSRIRGLSREVILLGVVSLLADVSSEMLTPVAPLFLTLVIGASATDLGLIEGVAESLASLLKGVSGRWSDRIGKRRPFIVSGYLLTALAKPLVGVSRAWPQVLAARALDRLGKGIRGAPRDALIADSVPLSEQGRAFGWHRSMDTLGAIIGPLLTLGLMALVTSNLRSLYMIAFVPGLVAVGVTLLVRDIKPAGGEAAEKREETKPPLERKFKSYLVVWALFSLGNSSDAFLILRAKTIGFSTIQTILVYSLYNLIYCGTSPWLGSLADRFGKARIVALGFAVFAAVYAGFASTSDKTSLVWLFAIYGIYAASTDGVGKAYAVELLPKSARGYGIGLLGMVTGLLALSASLIGGWLWDHVSPESTFYFGALGALCALLAFAALNLWTSRQTAIQT